MRGRIGPGRKNELRALSHENPFLHPERAPRHRIRREGLGDRGAAGPGGVSQVRVGAGVDEGGVPGLRRGDLAEGVRGRVNSRCRQSHRLPLVVRRSVLDKSLTHLLVIQNPIVACYLDPITLLHEAFAVFQCCLHRGEGAERAHITLRTARSRWWRIPTKRRIG